MVPLQVHRRPLSKGTVLGVGVGVGAAGALTVTYTPATVSRVKQ